MSVPCGHNFSCLKGLSLAVAAIAACFRQSWLLLGWDLVFSLCAKPLAAGALSSELLGAVLGRVEGLEE